MYIFSQNHVTRAKFIRSEYTGINTQKNALLRSEEKAFFIKSFKRIYSTLVKNGAKIDLYFEPKTLSNIKAIF
ncbi:hypothetical protein [Volucribacter amazonae]|uniref:Uncharacterized protein n=1 Tax=Volucribacter amazonae TaxID=256731 RepID=A0A9X4PDX1_9PAST|nr:hypothetical protein [Volucribacter amazonae]MDG6896387.1 hypothetical protein [Volucribacter amazonae]